MHTTYIIITSAAVELAALPADSDPLDDTIKGSKNLSEKQTMLSAVRPSWGRMMWPSWKIYILEGVGLRVQSGASTLSSVQSEEDVNHF